MTPFVDVENIERKQRLLDEQSDMKTNPALATHVQSFIDFYSRIGVPQVNIHTKITTVEYEILSESVLIPFAHLFFDKDHQGVLPKASGTQHYIHTDHRPFMNPPYWWSAEEWLCRC